MTASTITHRLTVCGALHAASGSPKLPAAPTPEQHMCGSCHAPTLTYPAATILSSNFASWDTIRSDGPRRWLCLPCAWVYKTRPGLHHPIIVTQHPHAYQPTHEQLRDILTQPIPNTTAVIIPTSGKRTITPLAQWGRVTTDGGTIGWTRRYAHLLTVATEMRDLGAWERSLMLPSPPLKMLTTLPVETHARIHALWREFDEARTNELLAPLLLRVTRKDTP